MKTLRSPFIKLALVVLFGSAIALSSCSKKNDATPSGSAFIMVTNAAEGSAGQDFYLDKTKLNASAVAYTQSSAYFTSTAGDHSAQFVTSGSSTVNAQFNLSLQAGQYYSAYYTGGAGGSNYFFAQDDLSAPQSGKAKVRFIHLASVVTSSVDFGLSSGNKLATNLAYRAASAYYTVDANTNFSLYLAGSTTAVLTIPAAVQAGKIYTIYVSGTTQATITYHVVVQN